MSQTQAEAATNLFTVLILLIGRLRFIINLKWAEIPVITSIRKAVEGLTLCTRKLFVMSAIFNRLYAKLNRMQLTSNAEID